MSVTGIQNEINRIKQNVENAYSVYEAFGADIPSEKTSDNLVPTAGTMKPVLYSPQTLTDAEKEVARNNIDASKKTVLGDNPTGGVDNDTVETWSNLGNGVAWISEQNQVIDQPSQYAFIINYVHDTDVFQIFHEQNDGETYFRSGDSINNWFQNWRRVIIPNGDDYIDVAGVNASETITVGNNETAMIIYTTGIGDKNSKLWIDVDGTAYFTEVYAGQKKLATEEYVDVAVEQFSNEKIALENEFNEVKEEVADLKTYSLTDADKAEIAEMVDGATVVQAPQFVNSVAEMTDTSRIYVLADTGHIWAYMDAAREEEVVVREDITGTTDNPYTDNARVSSGEIATGNAGYVTTPMIDLSKYSQPFELHLEGVPYFPSAEEYGTRFATFKKDKTYIVSYKQSQIEPMKMHIGFKEATFSGNHATLKFEPPVKNNNSVEIGYVRFSGKGTSSSSSIYVTYTETQIVTGGRWIDTEMSYLPVLTEVEKTEIVEQVASMIDTQLLGLIGAGVVTP